MLTPPAVRRFDFMGEMAFGTDFGMLKTGSDAKGIWHLMDKGILYASAYLTPLGRAFSW